MHVDVLVFGAHRDDVEITCGGTVALLVKQDYRVAIVDLSQGEMGTRGSAAIRRKESLAAAKILGVAARKNLKLPDAFIEISRANKLKVARAIREFTPTLIMAPYWEARHPDHATTGLLVQEAAFIAGLQKVRLGNLPHHRAMRILYYYFQVSVPPSFIVDVSATIKTKLDSVKAYQSQFYQPGSKEEKTYIARRDFFAEIEAKARYFGSQIVTAYGEPFYTRDPLGIPDVVAFFKKSMPIRL
jgi:bacillithiol biosynthesis deacetylase BshB1